MKPKNKKISDGGGVAKLKKKGKNIRKLQLLEANEEEDKSIRRLEKLLKINKKKKSKKKLPSEFSIDGLDYLLEGLEGNSVETEDLSDLDDDSNILKGKNESAASKRKFSQQSEARPKAKKRTLTELLREKEGHVSESEGSQQSSEHESFSDSEGESMQSEDEQPSDFSGDESETKDQKLKNASKKIEKSKIWEDIYGRFRDKEGNVIKNDGVQKYVPPSLRKSAPDNQKQEQLLKIRRNLKGLLNRLSESNLQPISRQVEEVYMKYGRNDTNETLFSLISDLVLTSTATAPRLIMEQAMLVALLHANVGAEIGAYFLQHLVKKLDSLFQIENYGEGKTCNNVLTFLSHLYNYKVAHSKLIFDIFRKLIDSFQSKDIELIQLFLKSIGFVLRKDDPVSLKEIVLAIQAKASTVKKDQNDSRINFMLETLTAIRNNNMYKIPDYDPSIIEHSKKILKAHVRKDCALQELAVSYEDLIMAEERGRWWIVGSAWSESDNFSTAKEKEDTPVLPKTEYSEKLLKLAQKLRMNTDVKKSIFCIIMTAEDYMAAFQKLLKLNLRNQQQKEIINVILHCSLNEKNYNPYYSYLAGKFCSFARSYQMALQFLLWDKFKEFKSMKPSQISNLAKFLSQCFTSLVLPLSILKVINFSQMDKSMLKFVRPILISILLHESEETCVQVFKRISNGEHLKFLRESLGLFMQAFILSNTDKYSSEDSEKLRERVEIVENVFSSAKKAVFL